MLDQITPENVREKAQEIKRRLSNKGQVVDENVICELLESLDPDYQTNKTDYVMEMIMDNRNIKSEKSLDEAGPSKVEYQSSLQNDTKKLPALESPGRNSPAESGGTIEVSDTEDDRDYYYDSSSYNDVSLIDNTIATSCMSPYSIYDTMLDQSTNNNKLALQTNIDVDQGRAEVEFLKENNNNDVIFMKSVTYEKKRLSESPKPGCSKDLDRSQNPDEYCYSCDVDELQIDAKRIHSLLPNFNYTSIYNALHNNQLAKNRIELTLWDLLPESRPSPQLAYKRKCVPYEARSIKYKKNSEKNVTDAISVLEKEDRACARDEIKVVDILEKEDRACARDEIKVVDILEKEDRACARDEIKVVDVLEKEEQTSARNEIKIVDTELKNEESIPLENEADEMKMDVTEELNNTNDDMNNQQVNISDLKFEIDVALEAKWNWPDGFDNIFRDVCDLEESVASRKASNNEESQSALNLTVPYKTEADNMHITTMSTPMPSTSTAMQYVATLNTAMPNSSMQNATMQSTIVSSTSMPGTSTMPLLVPSIAGPSTATPSTSLSNLVPSTSMSSTTVPSIAASSNAVPNVVSMSNVVTNRGTVGADNSSVDYSRMVIPRTGSPMPILPIPSTYIRPAKFTIHKVRAPFEVSSSSRQSVPILKPAKLNVTNTTQSIVTPQNEILTQQLQRRLQLQLQKREAILNNRHSYEETRGRLHSFVRPVVNNTTVLPNKMLSSGKTEERNKFSIANPGPTCSLLTATASGQSSKLVNSSPSFRIVGEGKKVTVINHFHPSLRRDQSGEDNRMRQRGDMNILQAQDIGMSEIDARQEFTLSHGMEVAREMTRTANNTNQEIILNDRARKLYYKLIPMFPSVDTTYIKRLVQRHFTDPSQVYDETKLLQILAEHLIDNGQNYPYVKKEESVVVNNSNTYDLNEQYADLLGIFPEADPMYLRKVAEDIYKDPEKIKEFVQSKLENPDYPTRAQYLAKKKITEQQKQYTTDFKIEQFLELFPNPFAHFENANRKCKFNAHALDFLKQHFSKTRVNTLINTYTENQHNLSLTTRTLEALVPDMKSKRPHSKSMLTEDIPLLQECAFIQHKVAIKKYLTELKEQEEKEFQELKMRNKLVECQCCYDNECMPSKCSSCENGHIFCNSCILRCTELILANGKAHVDCLLNCGNEFPLSVLQRVLPPTKFSILLCKRQEAEVMAAGLEGLVSCPFCHFASIPPSEDKVFRCLNPDCMKESCRLCKELNHIPLKCNEVKSDAARLLLEEKMTEALVRKCYKCGRTFFKEEGCNKMTCPCGAQMCYICDKPVVDYKHFQGQGVQDSTLCPLWSDDRRMNAESVIKVCHETLKQIKNQNPQVDIDVNALLPKLPPKRKGPHDDIAFANALPAHAERLARHNP